MAMKNVVLAALTVSGLLLSESALAEGASEAPASQSSSREKKQSRGNSFNPEIGINGLFLYQNSNRGNDTAISAEQTQNGFSIQEAELQFSADVDPYWRFVGLFSVHPEAELDATTGLVSRSFVFEPEEVYAESLSIPYVLVRAGKFKTAFGRHNTLHTHAFPFIDAPLVQSDLLGEDGLNDVGLSASILVPALPWFSEITVQGLSGRSEGLEQFGSPSPNDAVGLAHLKNLFDLNDETTIELGLSGATGRNSFESYSDLLGVDLMFKWRPVVFGSSRAFVWSTEAITRNLNRTASKEVGKGFVTYLQLQLASQWWVQARAEYLEKKDDDVASPVESFERKNSALLGFVTSEFSAIRLQYDRIEDGSEKPEQKISLQLNYSIGAHPAHLY